MTFYNFENVIMEHPLRRRRWFVARVCLALLVAAGTALGGDEPRPNLAVFQSLARDLGKRMGESIHRDDSTSVELVIRPSDQAWIIQGPLTEGISGMGKKAVMRDGEIAAECTIASIGVTYENARRTALFGERLVDRVVNLRIQALISERRSGTILGSSEYADSVRDTVQVSAISRLEDPTVSATRGEIPRDSFFSTFAEPIIMIAAVAVSVLLLFHVRS